MAPEQPERPLLLDRRSRGKYIKAGSTLNKIIGSAEGRLDVESIRERRRYRKSCGRFVVDHRTRWNCWSHQNGLTGKYSANNRS
jgi:hypothetical protein